LANFLGKTLALKRTWSMKGVEGLTVHWEEKDKGTTNKKAMLVAKTLHLIGTKQVTETTNVCAEIFQSVSASAWPLHVICICVNFDSETSRE